MSILKVKKGDEWVDVPALAGVQDVTLAGTSCVQGGVAEIPHAVPGSASTAIEGTVRPNFNEFTNYHENGTLGLNFASDYGIESRSTRRPLQAASIDKIVRTALCDGKGAAWSATEQAAAMARLGLGWTWTDVTIDDGSSSVNSLLVGGFDRKTINEIAFIVVSGSGGAGSNNYILPATETKNLTWGSGGGAHACFDSSLQVWYGRISIEDGVFSYFGHGTNNGYSVTTKCGASVLPEGFDFTHIRFLKNGATSALGNGTRIIIGTR